MLYRLEHEISINAGTYNRALQQYEANSPKFEDADLNPSFIDLNSGVKERAGFLFPAWMNKNEFTGAWLVDIAGDEPENIGYEAMLAQAGIPKDTEYYAWEGANQHLVGGKRIDEKWFAVTSIFNLKKPLGGRPVSEATRERQRKAEELHKSTIARETDASNPITYRDVRAIAKAIGSARPSRVHLTDAMR